MPATKTYLIVFAAEEGAQLLARWGTEREYEQIKAQKTVVVGQTMFGSMISDVNYVALCKIERDHDFTIGGPREAKRG